MLLIFQNCTLDPGNETTDEHEGTENAWDISFTNTFHGLRCSSLTTSSTRSEIDTHNQSLALLENQLAENGQDAFIDLSYLDL